ncbi:hypothetical protein [Sporosarcina ureae]|uniref:hypothetical protein n=1 Tax=Sporosarcina ureae TaxID=1571 RepID=UPI0026F1EABC|nr:hypothetical protein [Sporosarcina ureae]
MDLNTGIVVLRNLFMGLFIILFVVDIYSKKSYKVQYNVSLTLGVVFSAVIWDWLIGFKVGFIALYVIFAVKTIFDVRKREVEMNADV